MNRFAVTKIFTNVVFYLDKSLIVQVGIGTAVVGLLQTIGGMMRIANVLKAAIAVCGLAAGLAQANVVSVEKYIARTDPGAVQYVGFSVSTAGSFDIRAQGSGSLGTGYNGDPEIYLFSGSLSQSNLIGSNDDGGGNLDSLIASINLAVGNYILAVSEYSFSSDEAISGINAASVDVPGLVRLTFSSANGFATLNSVPEPGSLALLGLGVAGLALARRRKAA